MSTMLDICTGAARRLQVIQSNESLSSEDARDILDVLNKMMAAWKARGVDVQHDTALTQQATFPLPYEHEAGVEGLLAVEISGPFEMPIPVAVARTAADGWAALNAAYRLPEKMRVDRALGNMPSQRRWSW